MRQPVQFLRSIVTRLGCLTSLIFIVFIGVLMLNYFLARQTEKRVTHLVEKDIPQLIKNERLSRNLSRLSDDIKIMLINFTGEDYALKPELDRLLPLLTQMVASSLGKKALADELKDLSDAVEDLFGHCIRMDDVKQSILSAEKKFMEGMNSLELSTIDLIIERKLQGRDYELDSLEQISALIPDIRNLLLQIKLQVSWAERAYFTGKRTNQADQKQVQAMLADIESGLTAAKTAGDTLLPIGEKLTFQIHDYREKIMGFYQQMAALEKKIATLCTRQLRVNEIMAAMGNNIEKNTQAMQNQVIADLKKLSSIRLVLSFTIIVLLIIVTIVGARIARPIQELTTSAMEIAAGNLEQAINTSGNDEVGVLSRSFAGMRDALKDKIDDLAEKNRDLLREIVERKRIETALRKSENKYRTLVENFPQKVLLKDTKSVYISANEAFCQELKIHPDHILGRTDHDFFPEEIAEKYIADDKRIMASGRTEELEETYILNGQESIINTVKTPIKNDAGKIVGILTIFWDITRTKQLEAQLAHSQKMEAIGTLAGGIAHDFNNILGVIMGYTELVRLDTPDQEKHAASLDQVLKAAGRAKDLASRILTFSRQGEHQKKPIRLSPIIEEVLKMIRPSIPSTIEIQKEIEGSSGVVLADPTEIYQVLINLCTNASYAMRESGGVLRLGLEEMELSDGAMMQHPTLNTRSCMRITVSDTGHGIRKGDLDRIFEPYYTTKGKSVGTGLGLAVVHGIVQNHGGAIDVISSPGKGTVFHVYFPRITSDSLENQAVLTRKKLPRGKGRIFLVDDDAELLEVGVRMLGFLGYDTVVQNCPIEALKNFQADPEAFDLVITDQTMPKMTGHDLAQAFLKIRPNLPVILCTGYSELIDEKKAKKTGVQEFIMKPFTMDTLSEAVWKALGNAPA